MTLYEQSSSNEYATANDVALRVVEANSFDTFVHFQELSKFQNESGIPVEQWALLLREWDYSPSSFLENKKRGNCVDFASLLQTELNDEGIKAEIIGKVPDEGYNVEQRKVMGYRHTSVLTEPDGQLVMFEPGWKIPRGIPLCPINKEVDTGTWKFKTLDMTLNTLTQETTSPLGKIGIRSYGLIGLTQGQTEVLTKNLMRIPRRMEMLTPFSKDIPHHIISFNPHTGTLHSTMDELGKQFILSDLTTAKNEEISSYYGYDVKEELLSCFGIYRALPKSFWVR